MPSNPSVVAVLMSLVSGLSETSYLQLGYAKAKFVVSLGCEHKNSCRYFCDFVFFVYLCSEDMIEDERAYLFRKLKEENCFWSYDVSKMVDISDEALIEHVLLYLDIDDINRLFPLFGYKKVKRVWLDRVAPQGEMFRQYNILYAWYYFGAKRPEAYVKSLETRHINRIIAA